MPCNIYYSRGCRRSSESETPPTVPGAFRELHARVLQSIAYAAKGLAAAVKLAPETFSPDVLSLNLGALAQAIVHPQAPDQVGSPIQSYLWFICLCFFICLLMLTICVGATPGTPRASMLLMVHLSYLFDCLFRWTLFLVNSGALAQAIMHSLAPDQVGLLRSLYCRYQDEDV